MNDIPIILNNFNRLSTTKKLADDLSKLGYTNIHILDNDSTYPPLLDWYEHCAYKVELMGKNYGQLAVYNSDYINKFKGWVAYSDSDIELNPFTPKGMVEGLIRFAERYNKPKAGLALRIDDLPHTTYSDYVWFHEQKYWDRELESDVYEANVDTTFSVIKVGEPFTYEAIRLGGNYTARHIPWYLDYDNLTEEEKYYIEHSSSEFSTTKRFVDSLSLQDDKVVAN
jgi:hypothetical protein